MLMASQVSFCVFVISLLLGIASASEGPGAIGFSYSGNNGPDKWGKLDPSFSLCSSGKKQSPINIMKNYTSQNKALKPLDMNYKSENASLVNNGFNVGVHFEQNPGDISIDGKNYSLTGLHWHLPSEHRINEAQFAAELHLVHRAADQSFAVIGILFEEGDEDPLIANLADKLKELTKENCKPDEVAQIPIGTLDTKPLKKYGRKYYRYVGSLTTPPCTEDVTWSILAKVRSISKEQMKLLETPLKSDCKHNARPCQAWNGRKIEMFE